ncbi:MAG: cobalt transporter CbiM [Desulfuromonadales bacterium]|nr:cobalt transporter CbiM [Desulfuromonadales bacterium]
MHIPDGYLSPQTYVPFYAFIIPYLGLAARKVRSTVRSRHVPLLALGAAFSFVIMMFNVPIPGGTTGHAVGGVIVAILLGPWAASIAVSIALIVQALLFGDGGITAIGANCFNMGVVIPFIGYYTYALIAGKSAISSPRRWIAGAVAGYLALNIAAVCTGIEFGIQPLIASAPDGHPLYAPYPLSIAVPAMAIEHLILFGFIEALVTALVIKYLQKTESELLTIHGGAQ